MPYPRSSLPPHGFVLLLIRGTVTYQHENDKQVMAPKAGGSISFPRKIMGVTTCSEAKSVYQLAQIEADEVYLVNRQFR